MIKTTYYTGPYTHPINYSRAIIPNDIYLFDIKRKELFSTICSTRPYKDPHFTDSQYLQQKIPIENLFNLTVKTLTGQSIKISVPSKDAEVSSIMFDIKNKQGIDVTQQRLVYSGQHLNPNNKISRYEIKNNSTIYLVLCLRAGMKHRVNTGGDSRRHGETVRINVIFGDKESTVTMRHGTEWGQINAALSQIVKNGNIPKRINLAGLSDSFKSFNKRDCFQLVSKEADGKKSAIDSIEADGKNSTSDSISDSINDSIEANGKKSTHDSTQELLQQISQIEMKMNEEKAIHEEKQRKALAEAEKIRSQIAALEMEKQTKSMSKE